MGFAVQAFGILALLAVSTTDAQAINATALTAIAPTYNGEAGNLTFVRFYNMDPSAKEDFSVTVVGSPSGRTYGTTTYTVPANASPQFSLSAIVAQANAGPLTAGDDNYTLYVRNANQAAAYQHVLYNSINNFFENVTACIYFQGAVYKGIPQTLANVHTTTLAGFPSRILIHNAFSAAVTYRVSLYDAANGTLLGKVDLPLGANTSKTYPESFFEDQLKWTPSATQLHVNMMFEQVGSNADFYANISHVIFNSALNASINMSTLCRVQH